MEASKLKLKKALKNTENDATSNVVVKSDDVKSDVAKSDVKSDDVKQPVFVKTNMSHKQEVKTEAKTEVDIKVLRSGSGSNPTAQENLVLRAQIASLEQQLADTKAHLKRYTFPEKNKRYYQNHRKEIIAKQIINNKKFLAANPGKASEYNRRAYLKRKALKEQEKAQKALEEEQKLQDAESSIQVGGEAAEPAGKIVEC